MRFKSFKPLLGVLFLLVLIPMLSGCEAKKLKEENVKLKQQFEKMSEENKGVQTDLELLRKESEQAKQKMTALEEENKSLKKEIETLKKKPAPKKTTTKKTDTKKKKKKTSTAK
ncbi:MAG: hypothetical protein HY202_06980 [Nitrospirae bacterium]|nr:hypothetical protein [Nitrospirota bacterium]